MTDLIALSTSTAAAVGIVIVLWALFGGEG